MYSGLDDQRRWTLIEVLAEQARQSPDRIWVETTDGGSLTFGAAEAEAARVAGFLAGLGVKPGDRVAVFLPGGIDFLRVWLALGRLGAVAVLLNTGLSGEFLRHQVETSGASLALADGPRAAELEAIAASLSHLRRVVLMEDRAALAIGRLAVMAWRPWREAQPYSGPGPRPQDIACIMFTSGTSGPSKGVLMPHAHCYLYGVGTIEALRVTADDRYYIVLPLFHANGLLMQLGATLIAGAVAIVRDRFSASAWLDDVIRHRATVTNTLGAIAAFIVAQAPRPDDARHALRGLMNVPNPPEVETAFRERFRIADVISGFGMTEVNMPIWGRLGQSRPGAAGWVATRHFEVAIVDPETDAPMPPGELGEIVVRPRTPYCFMAGYHGAPERTIEAWRNLWFHTGDAGKMDETGLVTFIDRIKDCIRRRGENISATEVEAVLSVLPGVAEVAAFAVRSDVKGGEDEIMLAVVPAPGATLSPEEIATYARRALPRFAHPRYVELVAELPKTATGKVQRGRLRERGIVGATWDAGESRR